jgi:rRNA maturation RNase YbeY
MLQVDVFNAHRTRRVAVNTSAGYVKRVLRLSGVRRARVSVVLVDSKYCRKINKLYLNHDDVTDVISFPLETGRMLEGEVYVNLDRARAQANDHGVSFSNEAARLIIHGTLHLVGYDDTSARKAKVMKSEEDRNVRFWFR